MANKMYFPPYQGLPFDYRAPVIDGFCEWEVGLPDPLIESGWVGATRLTYAGASGVPVMSFQALKDKNTNNFVYLSFVVRLDLEYDNKDAIIIVFQDSFSNVNHTTAGTRRLLIRPIINPLGAGAGDNPQNPNPDYTVTNGSVNIAVRSNRKTVTTFSKWNPAANSGQGGWFPGVTINGWEIRTRSWKFSNTDLCWSVELKIPTSKAIGGNDWIDFNSNSFGFYFNTLRFSTPPSTLNFATLTEFSWPRNHIVDDHDPHGPYATAADVVIPATVMGEAALGPGGEGVYFDGGWNSIGVLSGGTVTGTLDGTLNAVNTLVANLKNDAANDASGVNATFRIANFGIGPGGNADWEKIDPSLSSTPPPNNSNPTPRVTIPAGNMSRQLTMKWKIDSTVRQKYLGHGDDQCLLVQLDSDQNATFKENSYRRNVAFANLSTIERDIVVSGKGHRQPPAGNTDHEFLIVTSQRLLSSGIVYDGWNIASKGRDFASVQEDGDYSQSGLTTTPLGQVIFQKWSSMRSPAYAWIVLTTAFRRTGQTLTLGGVSYPIFDAVDNCSHVMFHEGEVAQWDHFLSGPGLREVGKDIHLVNVPNGGETVLRARYEAVPRKTIKDLPWWVWLLLLALLLLLLLISLFT